MNSPVLFFTFANSSDNPLPDLTEEDRLIYEVVSPVALKEKLYLHRDQYTTGSGIINSLREFQNRVSIFHFGGHANSSHLYLADQSATGVGLSQLLSQQKPLHLVFLNGCDTSGFVQLLLDKGVPAVIATTREINDTVALKLAEQFYKSLSSGSSIKESFDFAKGTLETDDTITRKVNRGIKLPSAPVTEFPWGLYYNDEKALDWKLEDAKNDVNPAPKYFSLRFALIVLPIIVLYLWSIFHFGFESLTRYLTILGAIGGVVFFLMKFYKHKFPGIHTGFKSFQAITLKPLFIAILILFVIGMMSAISSVRIDHPGESALTAKLETFRGDSALYFNIDPGNPDRTLLMAFINPFSRNHRLEIKGYEPRDIHYSWLSGVRLNIENLVNNPSVLVRLPARQFQLRYRRRLKVFCNDQLYYFKSDSISPSSLLGNQKINISEKLIASWEHDLENNHVPQNLQGQVIEIWKKIPANDTLKLLHLGDRIRVELLTKEDSLISGMDTIITKSLTDVLLK